MLIVPLPPWHDSWQTCILFLTTIGMAGAMLPVTSPSTSEGAGWHRAPVLVPHLLTTPSLPSASQVAGDPLSCTLGPPSLKHHLCALAGVWHHRSGPCLGPRGTAQHRGWGRQSRGHVAAPQVLLQRGCCPGQDGGPIPLILSSHSSTHISNPAQERMFSKNPSFGLTGAQEG